MVLYKVGWIVLKKVVDFGLVYLRTKERIHIIYVKLFKC